MSLAGGPRYRWFVATVLRVNVEFVDPLPKATGPLETFRLCDRVTLYLSSLPDLTRKGIRLSLGLLVCPLKLRRVDQPTTIRSRAR